MHAPGATSMRTELHHGAGAGVGIGVGLGVRRRSRTSLSSCESVIGLAALTASSDTPLFSRWGAIVSTGPRGFGVGAPIIDPCMCSCICCKVGRGVGARVGFTHHIRSLLVSFSEPPPTIPSNPGACLNCVQDAPRVTGVFAFDARANRKGGSRDRGQSPKRTGSKICTPAQRNSSPCTLWSPLCATLGARATHHAASKYLLHQSCPRFCSFPQLRYAAHHLCNPLL